MVWGDKGLREATGGNYQAKIATLSLRVVQTQEMVSAQGAGKIKGAAQKGRAIFIFSETLQTIKGGAHD
jgi:hypothetical protein